MSTPQNTSLSIGNPVSYDGDSASAAALSSTPAVGAPIPTIDTSSITALADQQMQSVLADMKNLQSQISTQQGSTFEGESKYANASGGSVGDPHLSFDGATDGTTSRWNDMGSHQDLVDANGSFFGGYDVSTEATAVNGNGVAYNKSATISTGEYGDTVTMGQDGKITVTQNGQNTALAKGQSLQLASGAVVSEAADGSVTVSDTNSTGGKISTTLSWNGHGVDVNFTSSNTFLGGDLIDQKAGVLA